MTTCIIDENFTREEAIEDASAGMGPHCTINIIKADVLVPVVNEVVGALS